MNPLHESFLNHTCHCINEKKKSHTLLDQNYQEKRIKDNKQDIIQSINMPTQRRTKEETRQVGTQVMSRCGNMPRLPSPPVSPRDDL